MPEIKNKKRFIYTIQEFEKIYLPKAIRELEIPVENNVDDLDIDLAKKITSRIDIKV